MEELKLINFWSDNKILPVEEYILFDNIQIEGAFFTNFLQEVNASNKTFNNTPKLGIAWVVNVR